MDTYTLAINDDGTVEVTNEDGTSRTAMFKDAAGKRAETANKVVVTPTSEHWYRNDVLHRDGGPAVTFSNGEEFWYTDGVIVEAK